EPDLLLSMPGHGLRAQLEREAQARGLQLLSTIELRSQQALLRLVEARAGTAFAPAGTLREHGDRIAPLRLYPRLTRSIGLVTRRGRQLPRAAEVLLGQVRAAAANLG